jgi:4-diphosphocytidyl-2-C-methyl-D-erythritol kinase
MVILKANAKINLFLHLNGKLENGYHLLESLMVFAQDIYDEIEITPDKINHTSLKDGEFSQALLNEPNNLIDKALNLFSTSKQYHCQLTKNIPIGAGLGGGSADAAVVVKFLNYSGDDLIEKLTSIGADLPVCYHLKPSFVSGLGEKIELVKNLPSAHLVLINPRKALLTKDVFTHNTKINTANIPLKPIDFCNDIDRMTEFLLPLQNNLTEAAIKLMPEIEDILNIISQEKGCLFSRMSGSGPTCFGFFVNKQEAIEAESNLAKLMPKYWIKYTAI